MLFLLLSFYVAYNDVLTRFCLLQQGSKNSSRYTTPVRNFTFETRGKFYSATTTSKRFRHRSHK